MTWCRRTALILALALTATCLSAQTAQERLRTAIDQVQAAAAAEEKSNPNWKEFGPDLMARLDDANKEFAARRYYFAAELLGRCRVFLGANHSQSRAEADGMAGFKAAWEKAKTANPAAVKFVSTSDSTDAAVVRAFAQAAQLKGPVLIGAAQAYADVTNAGAGFYYIGEGEANVAFAREVPSLGLSAAGSRFTARSVAPELAALQARVNNAFKPPLSQDKHPLFIRLNSTLKFAEELDAAGLYYGSLYQYLDATQTFAVLTHAGESKPDVGGVRATLDAASARLAHAGADSSIALLFVQRGQSFVTAEAPAEPQLRNAAAIASDVLPAYDAVLKGAPQMAAGQAPRVIDVTLVRWPYT